MPSYCHTQKKAAMRTNPDLLIKTVSNNEGTSRHAACFWTRSFSIHIDNRDHVGIAISHETYDLTVSPSYCLSSFSKKDRYEE